MNPNSDPTQLKTSLMAEWADSLLRDAQTHLGRIDTTLTLAEAKLALVRRAHERRQQLAGGE